MWIILHDEIFLVILHNEMSTKDQRFPKVLPADQSKHATGRIHEIKHQHFVVAHIFRSESIGKKESFIHNRPIDRETLHTSKMLLFH